MYKAMGYPSGMLLNIVSSLLFFLLMAVSLMHTKLYREFDL